MLFVKYSGNADRNDQTEAITFTDGRPTIHVGGSGEVAPKELALLSGLGRVLQPVDDPGYRKMKIADLQDKAADLEVDGAEDMSKDDLVSVLHSKLGEKPPFVFGRDNVADAPSVGQQGQTSGAGSGGAAGPSSSTPAGSGTGTSSATT